MDDTVSVPPAKHRPWLKWIFYPLLVIPLAIPLLFVVSVAFSLLTTHGGNAYREGTVYAGDLKALENDFRIYFHGRPDYPALPLEELQTRHLLSDLAFQTLGKYRHEFVPFSPRTSDSEVVLTVHGPGLKSDLFTKRDLIAEPVTPDAVATAVPYRSASPAPTP